MCGAEVQIVPDYNPLDEVLVESVKDGIRQTTQFGDELDEIRRLEEEAAYYRYMENQRAYERQKANQRKRAYQKAMQEEAERRVQEEYARKERERMERKRQIERKRELKRKKQQRKKKQLLILCIFLVIAILLGIAGYMNSYRSVVGKAKRAYTEGDYEKAESLYKNAIEKKPQKTEAYEGLADVYAASEELEKVDDMYEAAVKSQPENPEVYHACVKFYMDTDQKQKIAPILDDCKNKAVRSSLSSYISKKPTFSLDDEKIYDNVQELTLSGSNGTIYYTLDGSKPTLESETYKDPIRLNTEGSTTVRAVSYNKKGIPSQEIRKTYVIEFPVEDAPSVSPSTGQYDTKVTVEVQIPEGYTAYYTLDGETPTQESDVYEDGLILTKSAIFKVILMDHHGRESEVTTRNYEITSE